MKAEKVDRVVLYVLCLIVSVGFFFLPSVSRQRIRAAEDVKAAPRVTVTVMRTWSQPSGRYNTWWMSFEEKVGSKRAVQISRDEWDGLSRGSKLTIALLPDGTPHSLDMGAHLGAERWGTAVAIAIWAGATFYLIRTTWNWLRPRPAN